MKTKTLFTFLCLCCFTITTRANNTLFELSKNSDIYNSVMQELNLFYVDSINNDDLSEKTINAVLSTLDPYTVYIPEKQAEELKLMTSGEYGGIGSVIMQHGNNVVISEPYEGFPAQKMDLRCGDIIVSIDGKNTENKSTADVSSMLKGAPGTSFQIVVKRPGEKKLIKKTMIRETIQFHPISYYTTFSDSIGYIHLSEFNDKAYSEFKAALSFLMHKKHIKSLIIDLRGNGGGLIDEAVKIASLFVEKGTEIVSTKGRTNNNNFSYKTSKDPMALNLPLAILVDRSSASASEILSGAFQDLDRATIFGERTFGKGLVQSIRPIKYKGHLKITTAKYYTPSGRCVQAIDYTNRNEDGSVGRIPDSLTNTFKTRLGRTVRDGGGILPDSIITNEKQSINIAFYLYTENIIFDYATTYARKYKQIDSPETFTISDKDYELFMEFVQERNPKYNLQSEKILKNLEEIVKFEGYNEHVEEEIKSLHDKLKPNLNKDLLLFKKDIVDLLNHEIIKRYYYQKGTIRYGLRNDAWLNKAIDFLK
ncbi:MAG: S41 family peptidase [Paludibacteraceae bacterium]|nr:S41 family peptidase [Paludibacteraceae bacterium]